MTERGRATAPAGNESGPPTLHDPYGGSYLVTEPAVAAALSASLGQPLTLRPETATRHHDRHRCHW